MKTSHHEIKNRCDFCKPQRSGQKSSPAPSTLLWRGNFQREIGFLLVPVSNGDLLRGFASLHVLDDEGVFPCRQTGHFEIAVLVRHRKERMVEDRNVRNHPLMHVTEKL